MKNTTPIQDVNFKIPIANIGVPINGVWRLLVICCFRCYCTKSLILILFNSAKKAECLVDVKYSHFIEQPMTTVQYDYYRPPGGGRLFDMKVVSSYVFLRNYYI